MSINVTINVIACASAVIALGVTLYLWLLERLNEDESKYIQEKETYVKTLNAYLDKLMRSDETDEFESLLNIVQQVNYEVAIILNYKFWARSKHKEDYKKIKEFYRDSRYLISTIRRYRESIGSGCLGSSVINIDKITDLELTDIQEEYRKGLRFIIFFVENWE